MSELPKIDFCWVEGDCFPELILTRVDQNLTGFDITLHLRRKDGSLLVKTATPIDLTQGHFKFSWIVGDLIEGFNQEASVKFVDTQGKPLTSPRFLMDVRDKT